MKMHGGKKNGVPQVLSEDIYNAKQTRSIFIRILPVIILGFLIVGVCLLVYWMRYMPRSIGRLYCEVYEISSKRPASIVDLKVNTGESVRQGQLLVELDTAEFEAEKLINTHSLNRAKLDITATRAELALRQDELRLRLEDNLVIRIVELETSRSALNEDKATLETAREQLAGAQIELDRNRKLIESNAVAQQQLDMVQTRVNALARQVEFYVKVVKSDEDRVKAAMDRLDQYTKKEDKIQVPAEEILLPVKAYPSQLESSIKLTEVKISESRLRSPVDGVVSALYKRNASAVDAGTPILQILKAGDSSMVETYIIENWSAVPEVGKKVRLHPSNSFIWNSVSGVIVSKGTCIVPVPQEYLQAYNTFKYRGLRLLIKLDAPYNGPIASSFDITY